MTIIIGKHPEREVLSLVVMGDLQLELGLPHLGTEDSDAYSALVDVLTGVYDQALGIHEDNIIDNMLV